MQPKKYDFFSRKNEAIFYIAFLVVFLDQLTKLAIFKSFDIGQSFAVVENILHFTYVTNTGTAFGLFKDVNVVFIAFSFVVLGAIVYSLQFVKDKDKKMIFAIGLLLGGTIGNLIDRLNFGYVIDFIDIRFWPVFNIADSAITISVVILIFMLWKK